MPDDQGAEQVSCSIGELKSGKKFNTGHQVVLVVTGLKRDQANAGTDSEPKAGGSDESTKAES